MQKVIGIDLGTTNSVVAFKTRDVEVLRNRENDELTRSCVALRNDEILVGRHAFNVLAVNPENTILSVKRLMGGSITDPMVQAMRDRKDYYRYGIVPLSGGTDDAVAVVMGGKQYTPEQISAEILKKLKADAEEKLGGAVTHAVITVPAYFTEKQKNATRLAASYAGLKVLRLLAEPTAAAIAYGVDNAKAGDLQTVVVYDFGGGTFDVSVLNIIDRECLEMGAGGDRWLGGDNIDQALQAYIFKQVEATYNISSLQKLIDNQTPKKRNQILAKLRVETEKIKIDLSGMQSQSLLLEDLLEDDEGNSIDIDLAITRAQLEQLIRPMVERTVTLTEELLVQLGYSPDMISAFLLVGGSSCIPLVKQLMTERFGADKVKVDKNPMLAVAKGAAMFAQSLSDSYECPNCGAAVPQTAAKCPNCGYDVATEVKERSPGEVTLTAKHDLYIMVKDRNTGQERAERLFEKQAPLPASTSRVFRTAGDYQCLMQIEITSDVEDGRLERQTMGYSVIDGNVPVGSEFVFDFALDADEILNCKVYPKGFSNKARTVVLGRNQRDSAALEKVDQVIQEFNSGDYGRDQSREFSEKLAQLLQLTYSIGVDRPLDERWAELSYKVQELLDEVSGGGNESDPTFIAGLMCDTYPQLLGNSETSRLRRLIGQYRSGGPDAVLAKQQLEKAGEQHGMLVYLLVMQLAARKASADGSTDGSRLRALHDHAVNGFETGNHSAVFEAIDTAEPLISRHMGSGEIPRKPVPTDIQN